MGDPLNLPQSLLLPAHSTAVEGRKRAMLFSGWLILVAWLIVRHVFWRDEVRAFTLSLSGSDVGQMLRNIHGEGHPALWYLILRAGHDLFPHREVLPVAGGAIGIAAMALFAFRAPFRLPITALVLFSLFGAFEYVALTRNYGISALVMFGLAAVYPRVKDTSGFGLILAILCNTNVPSCLLAAAFLLFRFVEMLTELQSSGSARLACFRCQCDPCAGWCRAMLSNSLPAAERRSRVVEFRRGRRHHPPRRAPRWHQRVFKPRSERRRSTSRHPAVGQLPRVHSAPAGADRVVGRTDRAQAVLLFRLSVRLPPRSARS